MKLYYFIHLTGRDPGNSGIQRVVRNLGAALKARADVELVPVRWCDRRQAVVHVEYPYLERIALYGGPVFSLSDQQGEPIHVDTASTPQKGPPWLLMPEVPHLNPPDPNYPWVHVSSVLGYLRRHGIRSAFVFHDILPLSHFGGACSDDPEALKFVAYANALSLADAIFPVSRASGLELNNWFADNGVAESPNRLLQPILLPEEMIVADAGQHLNTPESAGVVEFCMWGTILPHKNQAAVLDAFNRLCLQRPELNLMLHVFGHMGGSIALRIGEAARRSKGRIRLHGFVDDQTMSSIVARCRASIFLSLAEGYGLPLAESLWLGKPCITSNIAPMTEIAAGGGCLLADPSDEDDIIRAIESLATNSELLATLKSELANRPMRRWSDYAGRFVDLLDGRATATPLDLVAEQDVVRKPILRHSLEIALSRLKIHDAYKAGKNAILKNNAMTYEKKNQGGVEETTLSFGPYIDLLPAKYKLQFEGSLKGDLDVSLTSGFGKNRLGHRLMTDGLGPIEFHLPQKIDGFEVVIKRTAATEYLNIRGLVLEEYYS